MVNITLDIPQLPRFIEALAVAPEAMKTEEIVALTRSTFIAEAEIKSLTPRVTGRLFGAWSSRVDVATATGIVGNTTVYAPVIEFGSRPHDIYPRKAKALYFNGRFAKVVHHPGTQGQHPAERGLRNATFGITEEFRAAVQRVLAGVAGRSAI